MSIIDRDATFATGTSGLQIEPRPAVDTSDDYREQERVRRLRTIQASRRAARHQIVARMV